MTSQLQRPSVAPAPEPGGGAQGLVLVVHDGGPRAGQLAGLAADLLLTGHLVYDGPQWLGVYRRTSPLRTVPTTHGDAEVWTVLA